MRLAIQGRLEREQGSVSAVCDTAPILTWGADERDALDGIGAAVAVYLEELSEKEWISLYGVGRLRPVSPPVVERDGERFEVAVSF